MEAQGLLTWSFEETLRIGLSKFSASMAPCSLQTGWADRARLSAQASRGCAVPNHRNQLRNLSFEYCLSQRSGEASSALRARAQSRPAQTAWREGRGAEPPPSSNRSGHRCAAAHCSQQAREAREQAQRVLLRTIICTLQDPKPGTGPDVRSIKQACVCAHFGHVSADSFRHRLAYDP